VSDSGEPVEGNNRSFRYTFEEPGIYRYVCSVHRDRSGRDAVIVEDGPVGGSSSG
jgi:plastocyanin